MEARGEPRRWPFRGKAQHLPCSSLIGGGAKEGRACLRLSLAGSARPARWWVCLGGGGALARVAGPERRRGRDGAPPERAAQAARIAGSRSAAGTGSRVCVWSGARGVRRDEHGAVAGELVVRLLAERDGGAHFRLFHHHRLQRPERPGAAARLSDHAVSAAEAGRRAGAETGRPRGATSQASALPRGPSRATLAPQCPAGRNPQLPGPPSAPTLRLIFPGLLLNFNFERYSGRCLCVLPVPHFPLPARANEGATQQQNGRRSPPPASGPAPESSSSHPRAAHSPTRSEPGPQPLPRAFPRSTDSLRLPSWRPRLGCPERTGHPSALIRRVFSFIFEGPVALVHLGECPKSNFEMTLSFR